MKQIVATLILGLIIGTLCAGCFAVPVVYAECPGDPGCPPVDKKKTEGEVTKNPSQQPPKKGNGDDSGGLPDIILLEPIAGKNFEMPKTGGDNQNYSVRIVEEYLAYIYPYAVALIASLSVFMTVLGGFQVATAGGDSAKVGEGKDRIMYAIGGLVLLLIASLILYTINPTFFSFG